MKLPSIKIQAHPKLFSTFPRNSTLWKKNAHKHCFLSFPFQSFNFRTFCHSIYHLSASLSLSCTHGSSTSISFPFFLLSFYLEPGLSHAGIQSTRKKRHTHTHTEALEEEKERRSEGVDTSTWRRRSSVREGEDEEEGRGTR